MEKSPILIVDDDSDDLDLIETAAEELKIDRPIHYFSSGKDLLAFMRTATVPPFLIICDVKLPSDDGFEIRQQIHDDPDLNYKSVPFVFWSTSASEKQVQAAYDLPAQGFFVKPNDFKTLCQTLRSILDYWKLSQHPKRVL